MTNDITQTPAKASEGQCDFSPETLADIHPGGNAPGADALPPAAAVDDDADHADGGSCGCVLLDESDPKHMTTAAFGQGDVGGAYTGDGTITGGSGYFADGPRFQFALQSMELAGPWGDPGGAPRGELIYGGFDGNRAPAAAGPVNHAPTGIDPCHLSVDENSACGTVVGKLHTVDPDAADSHVYEIVGGHPLFEIDGDVIRVKHGAQLDYETQDSYDLTIRTTDSHGQSVIDTVRVNINDVNEAPVASGICDQTAPAGSHFSLAAAGHFSDVDHCDKLTYSIDGPDWLSIDPHTGVISGNVPSHLTTQDIAINDGYAALPSSGVLHLQTDYLYGNAGYNNSVGYYIADANGIPIGGAIIESNAHQYGHHDTFIDLSQYPGGASLGFFIIQNGASAYSGLADGMPVTFAQVDGQWIGSAGGTVLNKDAGKVLFSDQDLNVSHYDHLKTAPGAQMGWEDLWQGGDKDFDDVAMNAKLQLIQLQPDDCDQTVTVTATDKGGLTAETSFDLDLTTANASFGSVQAGNDSANLLIGNASSNLLSGGGGNDTLIGGNGHDYLIGGAGNDTLHGGLGSDILIGGDGSDRFVFNNLDERDTVIGGNGASWTDVIDLSGLPGSASHDWTLVLTHGSILSQTAHDIVLSTDAQGAIQVGGETRIAFHGIENIHM
jgi:Ca2+-binding RTX toxin-like protein